MAKNEVLITLQLVQKGGKISVVAKDTEKLADSTKKVDTAQKSAARSGEKFHKGINFFS